MRKVMLHTIIIASALAIATGCTTKAADSKETKTQTPKLPVDVKVVSLASLEQSEVLAGSILPARQVEVMSEITRIVKSVAFRDGGTVAKGQLLYKLDDADIRAKQRQLSAEVELARINESRFSELLKTETVKHEEYDAALAKKLSLEAAADLLGVELSKTYIKSPFSGRIGISKVQVGALVNPGLALVTLQEQGTVKVQFTVPEKHLPFVKTGGKITFDTESAASVDATIVATEPGVDLQSRSITVQAIARNKSGKLKPGMSATIRFKTQADNALGIKLPTQAFVPGTNGYSVFVVKGGVAKIKPVTIGNRDEEEVIVTSGLSNGDTVMISNVLRAMDGTPVQAINN